jgi:putative copper export protein/mono/diheme cytochrome c family protein
MDTGTAFLSLMRGAQLAALLSLFGTLLFTLAVAPAALRAVPPATAETVRAALTRQARLGLFFALVLGIGWFAALPAEARDTWSGQALVLRTLLLLATLKLLPRAPITASMVAGLALVLQPALGHAGAQGGGAGAMLAGAEALHLLAAGAWFGGLLPLLLCIELLPSPQAAPACKRSTMIWLASVGVIAITGVLQAGALVGSVPALLGTVYGRVMLLKLGLFAALLGLAVPGRLRFAQAPVTQAPITQALAVAGPPGARRRLRQSAGVETAIGLAIVVAAGCLAALPPAAQQQPLWPFSWRLSLAALDDPQIRLRVALALAAAGVGVASAVLGSLWRRPRAALLVFAALLLVAAAPTVRLLLVEAYPTSYYRSPTGFAADSIMRGGKIFAANCAVCHGAEGHGDGPLASQLPVRPADLTAPHLWGHRDGELFWWVSNGLQYTDRTQLMPAFAAVLPDTDRWSVIDFVRANNAGYSERTAGAWVAPIVAPALPVVCAGLPADVMRDLRGSVVRVVADGDAEGAGHTPAIPPQEGYKVLILHLSRAASAPLPAGECMAATPAAWGAYATLAGLPPDALPGAEFLVDPNGWLRAAWTPGSGRGWTTPDQLIAQVRLICTHPIANEPGAGHEHRD